MGQLADAATVAATAARQNADECPAFVAQAEDALARIEAAIAGGATGTPVTTARNRAEKAAKEAAKRARGAERSAGLAMEAAARTQQFEDSDELDKALEQLDQAQRQSRVALTNRDQCRAEAQDATQAAELVDLIVAVV